MDPVNKGRVPECERCYGSKTPYAKPNPYTHLHLYANRAVTPTENERVPEYGCLSVTSTPIQVTKLNLLVVVNHRGDATSALDVQSFVYDLTTAPLRKHHLIGADITVTFLTTDWQHENACMPLAVHVRRVYVEVHAWK